MQALQALRAEHAAAVLAFEQENRSYFAASISDRGDEFFERFATHIDDAIAARAAGTSSSHVLMDHDGSVIGRFNLFEIGGGSAHLGYRVAERVSGRGVATAAVRTMLEIAVSDFGLTSLLAAVSDANVASRRVLARNGFVEVGPAAPSDLGGKTGSWYRRDLTARPG